jgi:hypothetical protein
MSSSNQEHEDPFRRDVAAALAHMVTNQDLLAQQQAWQTQQLCNQDSKLCALETKTDGFVAKCENCDGRIEVLEAPLELGKKVVNVWTAGGLGVAILAVVGFFWGAVITKTDEHILGVVEPTITATAERVEKSISKQVLEVEARTDLKLKSKVDKQ